MVDRNPGFQILAHIVMAALSLFCILPIILLIISSITPEQQLVKSGYTFIPSSIDWTAYRYILTDSTAVMRGYEISVFVTLTGMTANLLMTILFAYPLSRKDLPGRTFFSFFLFFTMLFGGGLVPTYIMWTQVFHIKNTLWALIVPGLLLSPFNVIMIRTYFTNNVAEAVIESARIEGARELRILSTIVLPMSLPVVATVMTLVCLAYWNDWMNGLYYINDDRLFSIQVLLNRMLSDVQFLKSSISTGVGSKLSGTMPSKALKMAVAVLGILPMMVAFPFFQRYFKTGITVGAVKG
jgi:putative aldouronate transport system permease protein